MYVRREKNTLDEGLGREGDCRVTKQEQKIDQRKFSFSEIETKAEEEEWKFVIPP